MSGPASVSAVRPAAQMLGLSGPENAAWFLQMLMFPLMAPSAALTLEIDCLGLAAAAPRPWKLEPTISKIVPGVSDVSLIS
jgi:hypothetical protein